MPSPTFHRLVFVGLLSGTFALGCRPVGVTTETLGELPVARASAVAKKTPEPNGLTGPIPKPDRAVKTAGVAGLVDLGGTPMANADVQLFYAGQSTPFAAGKTGPDGRFSLEIGVIATGGGNVIATGGGNVISVGGGNVIATGGGNAIASGAPLKVIASKDGASLATIASAGVIATGGGNVIATGGGNVIATGGGNVISTGGGNYRVAQASESPSASPTASPTASPSASPTASPTASPSTAPSGTTETKLTLASTLTVVKLGEDLDKAMAASAKGSTLNTESAKSLFAAFKEVQAAAETTLTSASAEARTSVAKAIDSKGKVQTSTLTSLKSLTDALEPVALSARQVLKSVASPKPASPTPPTVPPASPSLPPSPSPSPSPSQGTEFAIFGNALAQGWTQTGGAIQQGAGLNSGAALVVNYGDSGEMAEVVDNAGFFDPAGYNQVRFALKASQAMTVQVGFFNSGEPIGKPITVSVTTGTYTTSTHPFSEFELSSNALAGGGISIGFKSTVGPATLYLDNLVFLP